MLFQFLPRLGDDEYAALEKSIREHGVQVPIVIDENKSVIDGHHRKEIADRLGVECPRRFAMDLTDEQKRTLALSLNLDRRHLSREQKRELIEKSLKADPHLSNRQHAERTGVSDKTVQARREELLRRAEIPHVDQHIDSLGRQQPARVEPTEPVLHDLYDVAAEFGVDLDEPDDEDFVTDQADLDRASGRGGDRRSAEARIKTDDISFDPPKPEDIEPSFYANGSQMASLSDGVEPEQFEDALAEAKAEGNVSRANVARKVDQRRPEPKAEPKPAQPKQRRRPLPEAFWHAAIKVHKAVESVDRLVKDDRFPQNAEKVAGANLSDLLRARDLLNQVIESMPNTH